MEVKNAIVLGGGDVWCDLQAVEIKHTVTGEELEGVTMRLVPTISEGESGRKLSCREQGLLTECPETLVNLIFISQRGIDTFRHWLDTAEKGFKKMKCTDTEGRENSINDFCLGAEIAKGVYSGCSCDCPSCAEAHKIAAAAKKDMANCYYHLNDAVETCMYGEKSCAQYHTCSVLFRKKVGDTGND